MPHVSAGRLGTPATWGGRTLLLTAIVFWWGGVVAPRLFSLAFPTLLPPEAIPNQIDPDNDRGFANSVSGLALATAALFTVAVSVVSYRRSAGWFSIGGWAALSITSTILAVEEVAESTFIDRITLGSSLGHITLWPLLVSPLIAAFVLAMIIFIWKGIHTWDIRVPASLGLIAWMLALAQELGYLSILAGRAEDIGILIEETSEFSGALLFSLSASRALLPPPPPHTHYKQIHKTLL